ncbi:hypothetical protein JMN32_14115 [Fulvivirga sp. 29W222]|uniref:Lipocalin-like domain-containing protein n=1 Tax=Fulvivirga marina TaxID=2494733 RepID=A0A937FWQ1_9BACT|nr:hypothetical protein [Fulvivirga marina]MBL6447449.1 hypothetical protein [Fulvivirga marina]
MMKRITFIYLVLATACSESQEFDKLANTWTVSWTIDNEKVTGDLTLFDNNYAQLRVTGQPNSLLVKENEGVNFQWEMNNRQLTLKRLDNDIELKYEILKKSKDYMELSFAHDITVKLFRQ